MPRNVSSYKLFRQFTNVSFDINCLMPFNSCIWVMTAKTDISKYVSVFFKKKKRSNKCWTYIFESFHNIKDHPRLWYKTMDGIYFRHIFINIRVTWSYIYQIRLAYLTTSRDSRSGAVYWNFGLVGERTGVQFAVRQSTDLSH